jgi:hypothetical protein
VTRPQDPLLSLKNEGISIAIYNESHYTKHCASGAASGILRADKLSAAIRYPLSAQVPQLQAGAALVPKKHQPQFAMQDHRVAQSGGQNPQCISACA